MELTAFFLDVQGNKLPRYSFGLRHDAALLVVSALGYDIIELEDEPLSIPTLLDDIRSYQTSDIHTIIDAGRPALIQYGGQIEGVTLPEGIPFKFSEVEPGYISEWVETIRQFALKAQELGAVSLVFPSE